MSSLRGILEDEPIDDYMTLAIQKAETQRQIRDKLQGFKNLKYESREKKLHFQMLGRVGYDRLDIPDITSVENQKAKGSFKLNEALRNNNGSIFSIKEIFVNTIKPIEFITWIPSELKQELIAVLLTELATRWYVIQEKLPRNSDPTKNVRFIAVLFSKIQEKLSLIIILLEHKFNSKLYPQYIFIALEWKANKVFTDIDNEGRLKSFFRLQIRLQINIDNLIESLLHTRTRHTLYKYHTDPPSLSTEQQACIQINQAADQISFHLKDLTSIIKKNCKQHSKRLAFDSNSNLSREKLHVDLGGGDLRKLEELVEVGVEEEEVSSCSEEEYVDNVKPFEFKFDANTLLNPLLCANITRKRFTSSIDDSEFDVVAVKAKRYLYPHATLKDPLLLRNKTTLKEAESMKCLKSMSVLSSNAQRSGLLHDGSLCGDIDRHKLISTSSIRDMSPLLKEGLDYELDPLFLDTEVSPGLSLPIAISMASDRVPKDLIKLALLPSIVDVFETSSTDQSLFDIKDSSVSDATRIKAIYDSYFLSINRSNFEADTEAVCERGCPAIPKSVESIAISRGRSSSSFTANYLVMKKTEHENKITAKSKFSEEKTSKEILKEERNTNKYNFGGYIAPVRKQDRPDQDPIAIHDYLSYINGMDCDFLLHVIIDERAESINKQKQFEEYEKLEGEKAKKMMKDKVMAEKYARRRAMTEFIPGAWNVGVLNMIEEMNARDVVKIALLKKTKEHRATMNLLDKSKSKQLVSSTSITSSSVDTQNLTNLSNNVRTDSMTDLVVVQRDLEEIWDMLKMPLDVRIEMAIKYSSTTSGIRAELAAEMWKIAANYVVKREGILARIERFETNNSDPKRYFATGYAGSSAARFAESELRSALLVELEDVDVLLQEAADRIERTQHESVTFDGVSIHDKIHSDYVNIMKRIQNKRRERVAHERRGSA